MRTTLKILLTVLLFTVLVGCAHTQREPEIYSVQSVKVVLYNSLEDLQDFCVTDRVLKDTSRCPNLLGFYRSNTIHCVKWDFEVCGHEFYHAIQRKGTPFFNADGIEHFKP